MFNGATGNANVGANFEDGNLVFRDRSGNILLTLDAANVGVKFGVGASVTSRGLRSLTETWTRADFTDGGAAVGTRVMTGSIPVGAVLLGSKIIPVLGFTGDTSAVVTVGDGSDVDRYHTGTPNVFVTAANGVESGVPSGNKLITTANTPTITITSASDFTNVSAGSITVAIFYIETA